MALARTLLQTLPTAPGETELVQASKAIQALSIEGMALHRLSADLFLTAIERLESRALTPLRRQPAAGPDVRCDGAARWGRSVNCAPARAMPDAEEKIALMDQANQVRPRTLCLIDVCEPGAIQSERMSRMQCPKCAAKSPEGFRFCESCGAKLSADAAALPKANTAAVVAALAPKQVDAQGFCTECGKRASTGRRASIWRSSSPQIWRE